MATVPVNNGLATATNLEKGVKLQETRIGHKKLFLPVPLDGTEQPTDRALVYYTATAKMESDADKVPYRTRLAVLAEILCLESVNGLTIDEIFRTYELQLWDPKHWAIRSYHDNTGATVPSAWKAGTRELKDIGNDTTNTNIGDIRPKNIMFAYVRVDLDFCHMANCAVKTHLETFIQLPQTTLTVKNGSGADHTYTSFMGGDVTSYTKEDFQDHILSKTGQQFPAMLASAAVGLSNASLNEDTKDDDFRNTLLGVFYPYLKNELFETLCPGLNNNPSDALDRVSQDVTDSNGNSSRLTVHAYFTNIYTALQCMTGTLDNDICTFAVDHMSEDIRNQLLMTYTKHRQQRTRNKYTQMIALKDLKIHATLAEKNVTNTLNLVHATTTSALSASAHITTVAASNHSIAGSTITQNTVQVNQSQAERTIAMNEAVPGWKWGTCIGCGSTEHLYRAKHSSEIVCPNKGRPGVAEAAAKNIVLLRAQRKSGKRYGGDRQSKPYLGNNPTWDRSNKKQKTSFVKSLMTGAGMSEFREMRRDIEDDRIRDNRNRDYDDRHRDERYRDRDNRNRDRDDRPRDRDRGTRNDQDRYRSNSDDRGNDAFMYPVIAVYQQQVAGRKPLPVPIDGDLPHFQHFIGKAGGSNPSLTACLDSGAGANVGYMGYFDGILFQHPECVDGIFTVRDGEYMSIKMSGIVSEDTTGVTSTDLHVAVRLMTPYRDREGRRIGITVALGNSVSVNFIIGNPWLKKHGAAIDYGTNRLSVAFEGHDGFALSYQRPKRSMVNAANRSQRQYFKDMMPTLTSLETVIGVYNPTSAWLPHVRRVIKNFQVHTLQSAMIPAPMPPGNYSRKRNPLLDSPAYRPANSAISPGRVSQAQRAREAAGSGSASAVSFHDGSHSSVGGAGTTYGHTIVHGNPHSSSSSYVNSDDEDLFPSSGADE